LPSGLSASADTELECPSAAAAAGMPDEIAAATARPLDGARDALLGLGSWDDRKVRVCSRTGQI
jgi:hypothetical protein